MEKQMFVCLIIGLLGVLIHCIFKANSLTTDAKKANVNFDITDYLQKDWFGISLSVIMVLIWLFIFPEVASARPEISGFVRTSFGAMGMFGSYIIQSIFSRGKTYIRNIVDEKTDIADEKIQVLAGIGGSTPPVKTDEK